MLLKLLLSWRSLTTTNQKQFKQHDQIQPKNIDMKTNLWHQVRVTGKINQIESIQEINKACGYNNISHNDLSVTTCQQIHKWEGMIIMTDQNLQKSHSCLQIEI